jgi:cytochrome b561
MMYAIIWVAFIEILIVMFPVIGTFPTYDLHFAVGVIVLGLAYLVFARVRSTLYLR